jgi:Uma2 family endonuclease
MHPMVRSLPPAVTADELASDARYRDCELWDGLPVVKEASGGHSPIATVQLLHLLCLHVRDRGLGWVGGPDVGFWLRRNPDRVLSPDAAFVSFAKLPVFPDRGFAEVVPDFVVEVGSPTDSWREVLAKGFLWNSHGVPVVWLVDPIRRKVLTLRPGMPPVEAGAGGSANAAPVLPDFTVVLDDLFRPPRPKKM